jgi:2-phosphosulfolactate phosphatase
MDGQGLLPVDVVLLPAELKRDDHLVGKSVVVFDVLRATSSMTAALAAGVKEIRIFGDVESAARAAVDAGEGRLLCGEVKCLPPPGFDLGNSPGAFDAAAHHGRTAFLATTNGTRAVIAAHGAAAHVLVGAIVNATAVARELRRLALNVTLLCAGTGGEVAMEDVLGAGAVLDSLTRLKTGRAHNDAASIALHLFRACRDRLIEVMSEAAGGRNLIDVGLKRDIELCAQLDRFGDIVGIVRDDDDDPLRVTR